MPQSPVDAEYDAIQYSSNDSTPDDQHPLASDPYSLPSWLSSPPPYFDYIFNFI